MKVLSLFDGISCGRVALDRAGIDCDLYDAYEIDSAAIKVSSFNYSSINHLGNVFDANYYNKQYDLLLGGSPCTFWSIARHNREVTSDGFGYALFKEYVRALDQVSPKYFLYENNFSISKDIQNEISRELGVYPIMLNSSLFSAQNRKRLYWTNIEFPFPTDKNIILSDVVDFSSKVFRPVGSWVYNTWGKNRKIDTLKNIHSLKSSTLTTSKTHPMNYYLNDSNDNYCNLSVSDWEKLQTLPIGYVDNVDIKETDKYKCIGNGWTVDVIAYILGFI